MFNVVHSIADSQTNFVDNVLELVHGLFIIRLVDIAHNICREKIFLGECIAETKS